MIQLKLHAHNIIRVNRMYMYNVADGHVPWHSLSFASFSRMQGLPFCYSVACNIMQLSVIIGWGVAGGMQKQIINLMLIMIVYGPSVQCRQIMLYCYSGKCLVSVPSLLLRSSTHWRMPETGLTARNHASPGASLHTLALLEQPHLQHQYWMCHREELHKIFGDCCVSCYK